MLLRKFGSSGSIIDFLPKKFFTVAHPLKRVNENKIFVDLKNLLIQNFKGKIK